MIDSHGILLLITALASVVGLVLLIAVVRLNPFISLFLASLFLAVVAGMPLQTIIRSFEAGFGGTIGHIAIIVALGTMLGKMMAESGGADQIAYTLIDLFGEKNIRWAMVLIGLIVGLPAFFEVGFVLLIPIAFTVARRTGQSIVSVGLPLVAGLSVVHGLVPPHPAAMMAVTIYHANVGRTIGEALLVGVPVAVLAGPVYTQFIAPHIHITGESSMAAEFIEHGDERRLPNFWLTIFTILLPVILMLLGSWADSITRPQSPMNEALHLAGNDDMALLIGALLSFVSLGRVQGFSSATILRFTNECLAPTAAVTLLIGAGGGFGRILQDSGVSRTIVAVALHSHVHLLLLAWLLAAVMRLATGSATVAMVTAAQIVAPIALHNPSVSPELLAIATGAGSLIFSHVNDGGFWLVKEYFGMSLSQTIWSWSVCETIIAVGGLGLAEALSLVLR
ncbi:MAG: gluconate:H+ symporter [Acidobacteriaceae bacterium]